MGRGQGKLYSINAPLRDGMNDEAYSSLFMPVMDKVMQVFKPQVIVFQGGAPSLALRAFRLFSSSHRPPLLRRCRLTCWRPSGSLQSINPGACCLPPLYEVLWCAHASAGGRWIYNPQRCPVLGLRDGGIAGYPPSTGCHDPHSLTSCALLHQVFPADIFCKRSWCVGKELDNKLPPNEYYDYFAPEFELHPDPLPMENKNTVDYLERIRRELTDRLDRLPGVPSTGFQSA